MPTPKNDKSVTGRSLVGDILAKEMAREIWTGNFDKAIPISIQDFDLTAVLPAIFFMFRWGYRRGKGKFLDGFLVQSGKEEKRRKRLCTILQVAETLSQSPKLEGFKGIAEQAILGDLLLCFCLENTKRSLGRNEQIQRVAPVHYLSSWVDLPEKVSYLRFVPEMVVAMLADQKGDNVEKTSEGKRTWFPVGKQFIDNTLIHAFHAGIHVEGDAASRSSDCFDEAVQLGVDQLLMVRLAQQIGEAPDKLRGGEGEKISNQRPIADLAAHQFSEDIRRFIRTYANIMPRQTLVALVESCISVGLTTIMGSVVELMLDWGDTGQLHPKKDQRVPRFFVDCSCGSDPRLRTLAEQSFDDFTRRLGRFPTVLMAARILDWTARNNSKIKELGIRTRPYATEWLNLLGELLNGNHELSSRIEGNIDEKMTNLSEKIAFEFPEIAEAFKMQPKNVHPVWPMAEQICMIMGRGVGYTKLIECMDSCLLIGRPNGLATKRRVRADDGIGKKTRESRGLIFSDSVLEYLVHLHLVNSGNSVRRSLSFREFLQIIRDRYGFFVDQEPPGMTISNDLLTHNRTVLERRLRDLGLLIGVNDAEAMKHIQGRFTPEETENVGD